LIGLSREVNLVVYYQKVLPEERMAAVAPRFPRRERAAV
jgi:hypothetical protein